MSTLSEKGPRRLQAARQRRLDRAHVPPLVECSSSSGVSAGLSLMYVPLPIVCEIHGRKAAGLLPIAAVFIVAR